MGFRRKRDYPGLDRNGEEKAMDSTVIQQIRQLYEVEGLSRRQIARKLQVGRKSISRVIQGQSLKKPPREDLCKPYERLIQEWYQQYPFLKATQVYERLRSYGFPGGYGTVKRHTRPFRQRKSPGYHELEFLPGEEAQIDWMEWGIPCGVLYGFVYLLAYSRYLFFHFYPRHSLEFFLDGHLRAFREIGGVPHRHRYDNLKSVVLKRSPEITFNPQFLDFSRHYGFSIHPCTPGRANEKGRVERVIRDIKDFLKITPCQDLYEANRKIYIWRLERNQRLHRSTSQTPKDLLQEENLKALPQIPYRPHRIVLAQISKTGFVELDTNRYSVPSAYASTTAEILAYPDHLEVVVRGKHIAHHPRSWERKQKIENPQHRQSLLNRTPNFKMQRIYQLLTAMDKDVAHFLQQAEEEGQAPYPTAHELFKILLTTSKTSFQAAVREAIQRKIYKTRYVQSFVGSDTSHPPHPVHPQNPTLLTLTYERRSLRDYDDLI
jgi:transposase